MNREYSLDTLKIAATIGIVFHHYQGNVGATFKYINFSGGRFYFGHLVELFFILAGYFMYTYIKKIKKGLTFKDFIVKRIMRLLPLLMVSTIAFCVIILIYRRVLGSNYYGVSISLWKIVSTCIGIQALGIVPMNNINSHFWYISVLILCYAIFYFLTFLSNKKNISCVYAYLLMIIIGVSYTTYAVNFPFMNEYTYRGYYSFFYGILLAKMHANTKVKKFLEIASPLLIITIGLLLAFDYDFVDGGSINYVLTFIFYPAIITILKTDIAHKVFKYKIIGIFAKISFNVYVWHWSMLPAMYIIIHALDLDINLTSITAMVGFLIISYIIGGISYYFIELPITKYSQKLELFSGSSMV